MQPDDVHPLLTAKHKVQHAYVRTPDRVHSSLSRHTQPSSHTFTLITVISITSLTYLRALQKLPLVFPFPYNLPRIIADGTDFHDSLPSTATNDINHLSDTRFGRITPYCSLFPSQLHIIHLRVRIKASLQTDDRVFCRALC